MANVPVINVPGMRTQGGPPQGGPGVVPGTGGGNWWQYLQGLMSQSTPVQGNWWQNSNPVQSNPATMQAMYGSTGQNNIAWNPLTQRAPFSGTSAPQPQANSNPVKYDASLFPNAGGARVAGGDAREGPAQTTPITANAGAGGQGGGQVPLTPILRAHQDLDKTLGDGWSAQFAAKHGGQSPILFYGNAFPNVQDPEMRLNLAKQAAVNDAKFQPDAIANWQQIHGNTPIPDEQWKTWWKLAQNGGAQYGQGAGINPYGNY